VTLGLGIDAGGTATRWVLADATGGIRARGEGPPVSGLVFTDEAANSARLAVDVLAASACPHGSIAAVLAGITGTSSGSQQDAVLRAVLAEAFGVAPGHVHIRDDLWIAHRARFAPGSGILVYCGTGSAAVHVHLDGAMARAGGHGYVIDDAGSGYAIARNAVRAVLVAEDVAPGSGWVTPLGRALGRAIGSTAWNDVRAYVYGGTRGSMAALAPAVGEAARAGDATAVAVLRRAGRDLARLARILLGRLGAQPVALAGGGARLHPLIHQTMQTALATEVGSEAIDAAAAAARIAAQELCPRPEAHVSTVSRG
jgi:N-acetylglucosamine kinase-like BadF-type ATPase